MRQPARSLLIAAVLPACAALAGCSTYEPGLEFEPAPHAAEFRFERAGGGGRLLATVLGVRSASSEAPAAVDVRIRLEADDGSTVRLHTGTASLLSSDLAEMRPHRGRSPQPEGEPRRAGEAGAPENPSADRGPGGVASQDDATAWMVARRDEPATTDVAFALPDGREVDDIDFSGLSLRAAISPGAGGETVRVSLSFRRVRPVIVESSWPWWGWGPRPYRRTVVVRRR